MKEGPNIKKSETSCSRGIINWYNSVCYTMFDLTPFQIDWTKDLILIHCVCCTLKKNLSICCYNKSKPSAKQSPSVALLFSFRRCLQPFFFMQKKSQYVHVWNLTIHIKIFFSPVKLQLSKNQICSCKSKLILPWFFNFAHEIHVNLP